MRSSQENNVRTSSPNAFRAYVFTGRAPALRSCGLSQRQPVVSLSFGSPFFETQRPFVGAHRRAVIQRRLEHNMNIGRLSRKFVDLGSPDGGEFW